MLATLLLALTPLPTPAAADARAPNLALDGDRVHLVWFEGADAGHRLRHAVLDGPRFGPATTIRSGADFLVNWADVPSVVRGGDGALWAHWATKSGAAKYAYDVRLGRSTDGRTWRERGAAHDDGTRTEHGFPSLWATPGGIEAVWLDGRETAKSGPMTLRWGRFGETRAGARLDARVCDCCGTAAAPGLVAYRDRANGEVRDIRLLRRTAEGWASVAVHDDGWSVPGCPVNGPALAADGERVVVAWFTGAGGRPRVRAAFSEDGGAGFGSPIEIDAEGPLGRVSVALAPDGSALVGWLATHGVASGRAGVRVRRVDTRGHVGAALDVGETGAARGAGFPRMVRRGDSLVLVWTHCAPGQPAKSGCGGLRAAAVPVADVPATRGVPDVSKGDGPPARRPDYTAPDLQGHPVALGDGPVLVNLWATWCGPCRTELATLERLSRTHPGVRVVAVSVDAEPEAVRAFLRARPLPFAVLHDPAAQAAFRAAAVPATRLYDTNGALRWWRDGAFDTSAPGLRAALRGVSP